MGERRKARETALQVLYLLDIRGRMTDEEIEDVAGELKIEGSARDYCIMLIKGVKERIGEIDRLVEGYSENWTITRMAVVDRNILRLAVYELLYCHDIPYKVVIDEAVELAKRFGAEDSGAFINGILDRIAREHTAVH